jgi:hypothetical protein
VAKGFSAWKSKATLKLIAIETKHKDNPKVLRDVDTLITKLMHLKIRDLNSFLALVREAAKDAEEFLSILPTEDEVNRWFEGGEEEWDA